MLFLSRSDVESLLDFEGLVDALAVAMTDLSSGRASMPPRVAAVVPERGMLAAMPAYLPSASALTTKLVSVFPGNFDRPSHQAVICCFDPENGTPIALIDGTLVTALRTAAGSALATRLLARPEARVVAIIGTGVQARTHARAMSRVLKTAVLRVAGRDQDRLNAIVEELRAEGLRAEGAASIEEAVRSADIVCATTHAREPVVRREWLRPGTHVNSVGYNTEGRGEVDAATIRDAILVVESRRAVLAPPPAGAIEIRRAIEEDAITEGHIRAEIGELVSGSATGRSDSAEITLYKSVGVAVQDAAAAALILKAAQQRGAGTPLAL